MRIHSYGIVLSHDDAMQQYRLVSRVQRPYGGAAFYHSAPDLMEHCEQCLEQELPATLVHHVDNHLDSDSRIARDLFLKGW